MDKLRKKVQINRTPFGIIVDDAGALLGFAFGGFKRAAGDEKDGPVILDAQIGGIDF